jgi:hypothetical protein
MKKIICIAALAALILGSAGLIAAKTEAPAWTCMAVTKTETCDATRKAHTRKTAETRALKECKRKCKTDCRITACIKVRE